MEKKISTIISIVLCITLVISIGAIVFQYTVIQEKTSQIDDLKVNLVKLKNESWNNFQNWILETLMAHNYWQAYTEAVNPQGNLTALERAIFLDDHKMLTNTIIDRPDPGLLQDIVFHLSQKPPEDEAGQVKNVSDVYRQICEGFAPYNVIVNPEFHGNLNYTALLDWLSKEFIGIPICLNVFEGGSAKPQQPNVELSISEIQQAMKVADVKMIRFVEVISWYMDNTDVPYPKEKIGEILDFAKNNNLKVLWSEWKISDDVWDRLKSSIAGYEDFVTFLYQTNNEYNDPFVGYLHAMQFEHWGGSVQSWYWNTTGGGSVWDMPTELFVKHTKFARNTGSEIVQFEPYGYFFRIIEEHDEPTEAMKAVWSIQ